MSLLPDVVRAVFFLVGLFSIGIAVRLVVIYRQMAAAAPPVKNKGRHVYALGIGWSVAAMGLAIELEERVGTPMTWRVVVYPVAFCFVNYGLLQITRYLRLTRKHRWNDGYPKKGPTP